MTQPPDAFGPPAPPPEGDPVYPPQGYPPGYGPAYGQQPGYPPGYGPAYGQQPGYPRGYPPGYPPQQYGFYPYPPVTRRKSEPAIGWMIFAIGVLTAVASLMPWATVFGISIAGTKGDGSLTVFCAVVISVMGLLIGLRQGFLWTPITALVFSAFVTLIAVADVGNVDRFVSSSSDTFGGAISIGPGLWLTLVAGLLGIGVSIVALVRRPVRR